MSFLNWIKTEDYSFNSFLLLERFQIALMMDQSGWRKDNDAWKRNVGIALAANPAVQWYLQKRCPEAATTINALAKSAPPAPTTTEIRAAEMYALESIEDFIIYTTPELMAAQCDFIRGWDKARLFDLVDLYGKTVLDVGAGSGRLTFAAAERAAWVYASEPVGTLREFMRDKIKAEGITNVRVLDGLLPWLPFPDHTFDVVMSGHVVGDDWELELAELARVCKPGGWLIDCPGDSENDLRPKPELTNRGWEEIHYIGSFGKAMYVHRKLI
ncbi:MAG: class I SAM-dependent methyltransferase [Defluviitaleaceae bacterium]|nr:class I SAM-dependent methyltransferase [Defluviitaleaceae bacterium]